MKILYVASRFHTNQVPIVEGWKRNNVDVVFVTQHNDFGREDHSVLKPKVVGYSGVFKAILKLVWILFKNKLNNAKTPNYFQAQFGFPPIIKMNKIIRREEPDIVILRDRCIYNTVVYLLCIINNVPTLLYNQTPYYENSEVIKKDIFHKLIRKVSPRIRITPVYGTERANSIITQGSIYVPFVIMPKFEIDEKEHFANGVINVICVGKYEKRKNHKELVKVIQEVNKSKQIHLTIIGECSREIHKKYYTELVEHINKEKMNDSVTLLLNLSLEAVYDEYRKSDLFILPSTGEFASISQLEAMSCSLPIICSNTNGTSHCIKYGVNGYTFEDMNFDDLRDKIEKVIVSKENIIKMGEESLKIVKEEYNFDIYKNKIESIIIQRRI